MPFMKFLFRSGNFWFIEFHIVYIYRWTALFKNKYKTDNVCSEKKYSSLFLEKVKHSFIHVHLLFFLHILILQNIKTPPLNNQVFFLQIGLLQNSFAGIDGFSRKKWAFQVLVLKCWNVLLMLNICSSRIEFFLRC